MRSAAINGWLMLADVLNVPGMMAELPGSVLRTSPRTGTNVIADDERGNIAAIGQVC